MKAAPAIQNAATTPPNATGSVQKTIPAAHTESKTIATVSKTSVTPIAKTSHSPFSLSSGTKKPNPASAAL